MSRLTIEERNWEAELAQQAQANKRLHLEHQSSLEENERRLVEALRQGGETARQRVAKELLAELDVLGRGRWVTSATQSPVWGTPASKAAEAIAAAARTAALETLTTFVESAEAELKAAEEERDRIVSTGKL